MTIIPFAPSNNAPFIFQATLDGQTYTVQTTWNLYESRWYINIYTLSNTLIYCMPLIGSWPTLNVSLLPLLNPATGKMWTSSLIYRDDINVFEVSP